MLLSFEVENHRSFRDPTEVSFLSTSRKDEPSHRISFPGTRHGVLPVMGVWGANASGKSNLLSALVELRNMVAWSFTGLGPEAKLPWAPWRLRPEAKPTTVTLEFTVPGEPDEPPVRHHYTVSWTADGVQFEALYAWPKGSRRLLYRRDIDDEPAFQPGRSLRRTSEVWKATRPNSLFLSAAAQFNHEQLLPVYRAIVDGIVTAQRDGPAGEFISLFNTDAPILAPKRREQVLSLLKAADLAVQGVEIEPREDIQRQIIEQFKTTPNESLIQSMESAPPPVELRLVHGGGAGEPWSCPSQLESDGTQKLLVLLNSLFPVLESGGLWVVDELDRSLHPDLCRELIGIFTNPSANPHGAQLLFATHSRELLGGLRTDEVVLIDRDAHGASSLAAASDYKDVRARDDLTQAHRQGRIGGVPILLGLGAVMAGAWLAGATTTDEED